VAIKINIASLKEGNQQLELVSGAKEIGLDEDLIKENLMINLELYKLVHQLDISAKISGVMKMKCDRCLEDFEKPFDAGFELVYVQKSPREEAIDDDYMRTYNPAMKTVDITNDIKEIVMLSVPMKKLPRENQDGSCSWCGKSKDYWSNILIDEEELKNK
jgi:uncharacterized metal-binding protein YceD (DUF177 family)